MKNDMLQINFKNMDSFSKQNSSSYENSICIKNSNESHFSQKQYKQGWGQIVHEINDQQIIHRRRCSLNRTSMYSSMEILMKGSAIICEQFQKYYQTTSNIHGLSFFEQEAYYIFEKIQSFFQDLSKMIPQAVRKYTNLIKIVRNKREQQIISNQKNQGQRKKILDVGQEVKEISSFFSDKFQLMQKDSCIKIEINSNDGREFLISKEKSVNFFNMRPNQVKDTKQLSVLTSFMSKIKNNYNVDPQAMTKVTSSVHSLLQGIGNIGLFLKNNLSDKQIDILRKKCFGIRDQAKDLLRQQNINCKFGRKGSQYFNYKKNDVRCRSMMQINYEWNLINIKQCKSEIINHSQFYWNISNYRNNIKKQKILGENPIKRQQPQQNYSNRQSKGPKRQIKQKSISQSEILVENYRQQYYSSDRQSIRTYSEVQTHYSKQTPRQAQILISEVASLQNDVDFNERYVENQQICKQNLKQLLQIRRDDPLQDLNEDLKSNILALSMQKKQIFAEQIIKRDNLQKISSENINNLMKENNETIKQAKFKKSFNFQEKIRSFIKKIWK